MPSYDGDLFAKVPTRSRAVRRAANSTTGIPYWSDSGFCCLIVSNDPSNNVPITHFYSWTLPPDARPKSRFTSSIVPKTAFARPRSAPLAQEAEGVNR
jgi:hypothetical protein